MFVARPEQTRPRHGRQRGERPGPRYTSLNLKLTLAQRLEKLQPFVSALESVRGAAKPR